MSRCGHRPWVQTILKHEFNMNFAFENIQEFLNMIGYGFCSVLAGFYGLTFHFIDAMYSQLRIKKGNLSTNPLKQMNRQVSLPKRKS